MTDVRRLNNSGHLSGSALKGFVEYIFVYVLQVLVIHVPCGSLWGAFGPLRSCGREPLCCLKIHQGFPKSEDRCTDRWVNFWRDTHAINKCKAVRAFIHGPSPCLPLALTRNHPAVPGRVTSSLPRSRSPSSRRPSPSSTRTVTAPSRPRSSAPVYPACAASTFAPHPRPPLRCAQFRACPPAHDVTVLPDCSQSCARSARTRPRLSSRT